VARRTGEEWLIRQAGHYIPNVNEEIAQTVQAIVLTDRKALHLQATRTFTDFYNQERKAGEEWLITKTQTEKHIPDVFEKVVGEVSLTTLDSRQYCVVVDPIDPATQKPRLGMRELRQGILLLFFFFYIGFVVSLLTLRWRHWPIVLPVARREAGAGHSEGVRAGIRGGAALARTRGLH
jgi:hypothetical protein